MKSCSAFSSKAIIQIWLKLLFLKKYLKTLDISSFHQQQQQQQKRKCKKVDERSSQFTHF